MKSRHFVAHPLWSWGCVWLWLAASAFSSEPLPPWETVETEFGPLRIREIGVPEGPFVVLIHDKPDAESVRNEWNSLARQLGSASFHVLIPDLHSAPEVLRPGKLTGETLREVFSRTLCSRNRMIPARYHSVIRPKAIVMGSSWGADMAAEVAALDDVVAVAMVSPQIGAEHLRPLQNIQGRVAVALTKTSLSTDGKVLDLASAKQQIESAATGLDIQWIEADADGRGVISNFELPLVEFAESARELFVHGGEL